jgi:hypothetical protein
MKAAQINYSTHSNDPSIEAIQSRRAPFIENMYNRNLRPIIVEKSETPGRQLNNDTSTPNKQRRESKSSQQNQQQDEKNEEHDDDLDVNYQNQNDDTENPVEGDEEERDAGDTNGNHIGALSLYSEKTDFSSFNLDTIIRGNDDYEDEYSHIDGGVSLYLSQCKHLKIVPSSVITKCLMTSTISLRNYGIEPIGCLALSNVLKVNF